MYRKISDPITAWVHFSLIKSGGRRRGRPTATTQMFQLHLNKALTFNPILENTQTLTVDFLNINILFSNWSAH